jgi:two-component system, NarL family, response regulator LiaR
MKKNIAFYGILLALLTFILKFIEYRFLIRELSTEIYVAAVALFFTALGIWVGLKITEIRRRNAEVAEPAETAEAAGLSGLSGISQRELEVLCLIAEGRSNQEIADQLFLSLNTIKTHTSNLFSKLGVKRRTQAVQKAKELGILSE